MLVLLDFSVFSLCQARDTLSQHWGSVAIQNWIYRLIEPFFCMIWTFKRLAMKLQKNFSTFNKTIGWLQKLFLWNVHLTAYSPLNWNIWHFKTAFQTLKQKQSNSRHFIINFAQKHINTSWACISSCILNGKQILIPNSGGVQIF